jgi:pimeloyl-ACP methyl ester carboxylesterase
MLQQFNEFGMYFRTSQPEPAIGNIVYLHGLGESGLCFEELSVASALAEWAHWVPDLPGYGKSPWLEQPFTLADHADYVAQWIQHRQIQPVVLVGHSMGGVTGLLFCEKYPQLVRYFINVEGNISMGDCGFSSQAIQFTQPDFITHGFKKLYQQFYRDGLSDPAMQGYYASVRICDPRTYYLNSLELVQFSQSERAASRLLQLKVPFAYILGSPRGTGAYSQSLLTRTGIKWYQVENAGHWPFIDQPRAFITYLLELLVEITSP